MELLKPFAVNGEREDFSVDTDPDGKVSLDRGFTQLYEMKPTEGGLFILRKIFNQMMYLVTNDAVKWKTQTFGDWNENITYPKNAIVKYTDGNVYVSKVDNNTTLPTDTNNWVNFEDFGTININALPNKTTPEDTDNIALQETGGLLKKLSFANLMNWIKSFSFGWGQTWQNVTASRTTGVTYTNNTGKPIDLSIYWNANSISQLDIMVNGNYSSITGNNFSSGYATSMATVPSGATYITTPSTGTVNIAFWLELR